MKPFLRKSLRTLVAPLPYLAGILVPLLFLKLMDANVHLIAASSIFIFAIARYTLLPILKDGLSIPRQEFHYAAYCNKVEAVKEFIQNGANPSEKDKKERTPLHYAASTRAIETMELLLENGADINCQDKKGLTPLSLAIKENSKDAVGLLLKSGANPHLINNKGQTAIEFLEDNIVDTMEVEDVIRMLKQAMEKTSEE